MIQSFTYTFSLIKHIIQLTVFAVVVLIFRVLLVQYVHIHKCDTNMYAYTHLYCVSFPSFLTYKHPCTPAENEATQHVNRAESR